MTLLHITFAYNDDPQGWMGLVVDYPSPLLDYMDNINLIPANERLLLDLSFQKVDQWTVAKLRESILALEVRSSAGEV